MFIYSVRHGSLSSPADWTVYAGIVGPLGTLFNPAYPVSRIIVHEGYDRMNRRNDIALIKLSRPLDNMGAHKHTHKHTDTHKNTPSVGHNSNKLSHLQLVKTPAPSACQMLV